MLNKIEGLLNKEKHAPSSLDFDGTEEAIEEIKEEKKKDDSQKNARGAIEDIVIDTKDGENPNGDNKIDLNRMASLLNGFNNK